MIRLIAVLILVPALALAEPIIGPARVIDGDTLDVSGQRIRLHGIDTPEKLQTCRKNDMEWACGIVAWGELVQLTAGKGVTCEPRDTDRYGRIVAVCFAGGRDISETMVRDGWALAYRQFSTDYVADEARARAERKGMWHGEFVLPWDWRRGKRLPQSATAARQAIPRQPSLQQVPAAQTCCKVCRKGKACGNSCIAVSKTCHKPRGCACDG